MENIGEERLEDYLERIRILKKIYKEDRELLKDLVIHCLDYLMVKIEKEPKDVLRTMSDKCEIIGINYLFFNRDYFIKMCDKEENVSEELVRQLLKLVERNS